MKRDALAIYSRDRELLTTQQVYSILDRGIELSKRTDMTHCLMNGGTVFFPHVNITQCGDQVAAVVHASLQACQNTDKKQILAIGVLHHLIDTLMQARLRDRKGIDMTNDPCRGIFGPGLPNEEILCNEFSLDNFIFLVEESSKRDGTQPPQVIARYPCFIRGQPETLTGIEELRSLAKESIIVATSDLCHHGIAYGLSPDAALPMSKLGYDFAYQTIKQGLSLLATNDLLAYRRYCLDTLNDSVEVGQLLNYLLGPLVGSIRDLRLVDVSDLFEGNPQPSWVAATLVELKKKNYQIS